MKHNKPTPRLRLKLIAMAAGMAALGGLLLFLSIQIKPDKPLRPLPRTSATAPATAPASAPAAPDPEDRAQRAAAQNMSGMLMLFSLVAFTISAISIGYLVVEIRRSRPAWMTQTRYPRRR